VGDRASWGRSDRRQSFEGEAAMPDRSAPKGRVPMEMLNIGAAAGAIAAVLAMGAGLSAVLPVGSPWLAAAAYLAPAGLAFAAYWWITQRV
jgi:hypothetical protein